MPGVEATKVKQPVSHPPRVAGETVDGWAGSKKASGEVRAVMKEARGITHVVCNPGCTSVTREGSTN